jgi:hypothetical protein
MFFKKIEAAVEEMSFDRGFGGGMAVLNNFL